MTVPEKRPWRPGRMLTPILLALLVYWTALFFYQRRMIFPSQMANAWQVPFVEVEAQVPGLEQHWIETEAGKTEFWFRPAEGASAESPAGLVVFTHGNAELIDGQTWVFQRFHRLGYHVAACEYRGYGRSSGSPSQAGITADHARMIEKLLERPDVDGKRLVLFGRSVGTGVACSIAEVQPPRALILLSPFRSIHAMAAGYFAPGLLVRDPFDSERTLAGYDGPTLILHGTRDRVIPIEHGEALLAAARDAQLVRLECGHNDVPTDSDGFWEPIESFLTAEVATGE